MCPNVSLVVSPTKLLLQMDPSIGAKGGISSLIAPFAGHLLSILRLLWPRSVRICERTPATFSRNTSNP